MNRQVGPSILLSLLIVAFFSFVLHQPDVRSGSGPKRAPRDEKTNEVATTRLESRLQAATSSNPIIRTVSSEAVADVTARPSGQPRKIRTIPRDIGRASGEPIGFSPSPAISTSEEPDPTASRPGRWKKVR